MQDVPQIGLYKYSPLQSLWLFLAFESALSDNSRIFMTVTAAEYKSFFPPLSCWLEGEDMLCWLSVEEWRALTTRLAG